MIVVSKTPTRHKIKSEVLEIFDSFSETDKKKSKGKNNMSPKGGSYYTEKARRGGPGNQDRSAMRKSHASDMRRDSISTEEYRGSG